MTLVGAWREQRKTFEQRANRPVSHIVFRVCSQKNGNRSPRNRRTSSVRLLQAEIQRERPEPEAAVVQALLLPAVHAHGAEQGPGAVLRALLEAHRDRRHGHRIAADLHARPQPGQELRPDEALEAARQTEQGHIGELPHARDAAGAVVPHVLRLGVQGVRHHQRPHRPPDQVAERGQGPADHRAADRPGRHEQDAVRDTAARDAAEGIPPEDTGGVRHVEDARRGRLDQQRDAFRSDRNQGRLV